MKGVKPEPLLGDHDATDLGIITFNADDKIPKTTQSPAYQDNVATRPPDEASDGARTTNQQDPAKYTCLV